MMNRVELNEKDLENVIGGQFHYNTITNEDGSEYMTCTVDEVGTFYCTENAKRKISLFIMNCNESCTLEDIINFALSNGYFWT